MCYHSNDEEEREREARFRLERRTHKSNIFISTYARTVAVSCVDWNLHFFPSLPELWFLFRSRYTCKLAMLMRVSLTWFMCLSEERINEEGRMRNSYTCIKCASVWVKKIIFFSFYSCIFPLFKASCRDKCFLPPSTSHMERGSYFTNGPTPATQLAVQLH